MVRTAYVLWLASALGFLLNELILIIALAASLAPGGLGSLFLGSLAFVVGVPLSWVLWYRTLYAAAQTDGATFMCGSWAAWLWTPAAAAAARAAGTHKYTQENHISHKTSSQPTPRRRCSYVRAFVYILVHMAWSGLVCVSPPGIGSFMWGLLPMISFFKAGGGAGGFLGVLSAINTGLWGLSAVGMWVLLGWSVKAFRAGNMPRQLFEQKYGVAA